MNQLKNLHGQVLLTLSDGIICNSQGQAIARTGGSTLLNLQDQVLAEVENGDVFRQKGATLLSVQGTRIVNPSGQHLATVDSGSQNDKALLAAAFLVFLQ